jgi:hypothetical protein
MTSGEARQQAERSFKQQERAEDGRKPMSEYEAQARTTREKTARLKALRLAKEAQAQSIISNLAPQLPRARTEDAPTHGRRRKEKPTAWGAEAFDLPDRTRSSIPVIVGCELFCSDSKGTKA